MSNQGKRDSSMASVFGRAYGINRTMSFLPELKPFLKDKGIIYTVRKYKMVDAIVVVEGIGECHRLPLGEISQKEELEPYAENSGFPTLDAWWKKIKYFIPSNLDSKYLYKVEVKNES